MDYKVKVETYEGPMDLLLNLIEENKVDIYDIPINLITSQFLDYIRKLEEYRLEITGDFLIMASTLLEIKSKMLLPKEKLRQDDGEEEIDPREELVRRLEEYRLYKEISKELRNSEEYGLKTLYKTKEEEIFEDDNLDLGQLDLKVLVKCINNLIRKNKLDEEYEFELVREEYTIEECQNKIIINLESKSICRFTDLIYFPITNGKIIAYFLTILELIKQRLILVEQNEAFNDLIITKRLDL